MVSTDIAIKKLKAQVRLYKKYYLEEVVKRLQTEDVVRAFQEAVLKRFELIQEGYFQGEVGEEDPTAPFGVKDWTEVINTHVRRQIIKSANLALETGQLNITLLSDSFVGIDTGGPASKEDPTPMKWLYYFLITGLDANLYWLSQENYNRLFTFGVKESNLGRFGSGFLMNTKKGSKLERMFKKYNIPLHPQSGQPGRRELLTGITSEVNFQSLVLLPASEMTEQRLRSRLNR